MNRTLLTIAIPTYKRAVYLKQAIQSAINQENVEIKYNIIVVNNDPETDMQSFKTEFSDAPIKIDFYTNETNLGMLGNVNRCVELSKGTYIAFLHDDDLLLPNYIQTVQEIIQSEEVSCLIPERYLLFETTNNEQRVNLEKKKRIKRSVINILTLGCLFQKSISEIKPIDNVFSWQNCYGAPSCGVVFNKSSIKKHGLFFPEGTLSWDYYSFLHLNEKEKMYILHKPVSVYRMTTGLSLKPQTQLDFFESYEVVKNRFGNNKLTEKFISKYNSEISYLNATVLGREGKDLAKNKNYKIVDRYPSKVKYLAFMLKRLLYYSWHNLDVEIPLDKNGYKTLKKMNVIK